MPTATIRIISIKEVSPTHIDITAGFKYRNCETVITVNAPKTVTLAQAKTWIDNNKAALKTKIDNLLATAQPYELYIGEEWSVTV
jgi:hypothetical protein